MRTKKGFTLIELLVVIAIIALLLAILMPSLKKAKKIAQQIVCINNCKAFGLANTMYANENDGCFVSNNDSTLPPINDRYPIWCTNQTYINYLAMSNKETAWSVPANSFILPDKYQCPSARLRDKDDPSWAGGLIIRTSYGMNGYTGARFFSGNPWRSTKIHNPSGKIIFIDGSDILAIRDKAAYKTYWDLYGDIYRHPDNFSGSIGMTSYRHNEKAVINFADGHADSMKKEDVFTYDDKNNPVDSMNDQLWLVHEF